MELFTLENSFCLLFLSTKCNILSPQTLFFLLLLTCLSSFVMVMMYWAYPGGHAWGKYYWKNRTKSSSSTIPGPYGLPVIGSMGLLANLAHVNLAAKAKALRAKRLMAFSLGETRVIVTCNPDVAKEILNSSVFADRPIKESAYSLMFNRAIGFAPYGIYWRTLRKIASTHLFCPRQISASAGQRQEMASEMVSLIGVHCHKREDFRVREILKRASLYNMMASVFGLKFQLGSSIEAADELNQLVQQGYELLGLLNWSDHLPWIASLDAQKIRFKCSQLVPKVREFVARIIEGHRVDEGRKNNKDFVDVLLSLNEPEKLSESDMIAVLWEMIFRGTDTVAILTEWILARIVLHPDVQSKVQQELDNVTGRSRPVTESDIASMGYLQAVIKEVLRLHPPGPLLSWARLSITDTTVDGRHVPAGTTAMVNMWAITRDPDVWSDPLEFMPERFLTHNQNIDELEFSVMGSDLRLAPFGSGRRSCPGKALGLTTVTYWVASLVHEFEWVQSDEFPVDLSEVLRLSCEMAHPLTVRVLPRYSYN